MQESPLGQHRPVTGHRLCLSPHSQLAFYPLPLGVMYGMEAAITVQGICFGPTSGLVVAAWIFPLESPLGGHDFEHAHSLPVYQDTCDFFLSLVS